MSRTQQEEVSQQQTGTWLAQDHTEPCLWALGMDGMWVLGVPGWHSRSLCEERATFSVLGPTLSLSWAHQQRSLAVCPAELFSQSLSPFFFLSSLILSLGFLPSWHTFLLWYSRLKIVRTLIGLCVAPEAAVHAWNTVIRVTPLVPFTRVCGHRGVRGEESRDAAASCWLN